MHPESAELSKFDVKPDSGPMYFALSTERGLV